VVRPCHSGIRHCSGGASWTGAQGRGSLCPLWEKDQPVQLDVDSYSERRTLLLVFDRARSGLGGATKTGLVARPMAHAVSADAMDVLG